MRNRWTGALLITTIVVVALAFVLPAHPSTAGSLDQEREHEQTVHIGVTSCGVERWGIKVRRAGACSDCL
jgi:hypothetical protein